MDTHSELKGSISSNRSALFTSVASLQDMTFEVLLANQGKGSIQRLLEYIVTDEKLPDPIRMKIIGVCRPRFAKHLCNLVVKDKKAEAKAMLELDPILMFEECEEMVKDHVERLIQGSAYRIAWGAGAHNMLSIMDPLIDQVPKGRQEASKQYKKQFPESKDVSKQDEQKLSEIKIENKSKNTLSSESKLDDKPFNFDALVAAITADELNEKKPNEKTTEELKKFKEHFDPKGKIIAFGKHFDYEPFIKALEIYRHNFQCWNRKKCNLFTVHVIAYFQRMLPACDFLAVCKKGGIVSVVEHKESVPDGDISLNFGSRGELGYKCFLDISGGAWRLTQRVLGWGGRADSDYCYMKSYVGIKDQILEELRNGRKIQTQENSNESRCVIL